MAGKQFTEKHRITYYEGDQTGHVTISMLMSMMILASDDQGIQLGVGSSEVDKFGAGWVVTQHDIQIKRLPKVNEVVTIGTEAVNHNDYFCQRDFWVTDESGNEIVHAISIFVMMDRTSRKIIKLKPEVIDPYGSEFVKRIVRLPKVNKFNGENELEQVYQVRYFDIDENHHVNNARYFEWILNTVDDERLTNQFPTHINIRYHSEVQPDSLVKTKVDFNPENKNQSWHQIWVGDDLSCEANIEWVNR